MQVTNEEMRKIHWQTQVWFYDKANRQQTFVVYISNMKHIHPKGLPTSLRPVKGKETVAWKKSTKNNRNRDRKLKTFIPSPVRAYNNQEIKTKQIWNLN